MSSIEIILQSLEEAKVNHSFFGFSLQVGRIQRTKDRGKPKDCHRSQITNVCQHQPAQQVHPSQQPQAIDPDEWRQGEAKVQQHSLPSSPPAQTLSHSFRNVSTAIDSSHALFSKEPVLPVRVLRVPTADDRRDRHDHPARHRPVSPGGARLPPAAGTSDPSQGKSMVHCFQARFDVLEKPTYIGYLRNDLNRSRSLCKH